ncbi:dioxygenase [Neisseria leonii]|uniref:Dioxygenase n=1 Tax=Neisseria leonii TaxID=2995413 RepID=A0A9X4IDD4_9NEIS|nr:MULTISPECIES: dioxygenase [unclassified Neisseria]MDD9326356.1 dioxygenase [Neisseria sp. 3986]MDD9327087.1 dioxygenase [Neisseria sp. 51.81]
MSELTELIRCETVGIVEETLDFMLNECSLDEAPDAAQVRAWQAVLTARGGRFIRLADMCADWLAENP